MSSKTNTTSTTKPTTTTPPKPTTTPPKPTTTPPKPTTTPPKPTTTPPKPTTTPPKPTTTPTSTNKLYKNFGITLLTFYIFTFLLYIYIAYLQSNGISNIALKLFSNEINTYIFLGITFLILIFGLIHGIYIFSKRKETSYTTKDQKDILTTTFVGYFFIIMAYIILFSAIIVNDISILNIPIILFTLLMVIGIILISVGLSNAHEKDKQLNNLKQTSIVSIVLITINTLLFGLLPASNILLNNINSMVQTSNAIFENKNNSLLFYKNNSINPNVKLNNNNKIKNNNIKNIASNVILSSKINPLSSVQINRTPINNLINKL